MPPNVSDARAECFDEPDDGIKKRREGQSQSCVSVTRATASRKMRDNACGIQMEVPDEFFRRVVEVAMNEGEEPEARYEDQPPSAPSNTATTRRPRCRVSSTACSIALCLLFPPADANHEEDRCEENRDPRVLPGGQPEVPGIADAQEIQGEAGRDVEEQEGDQEESRRAGLPVQRKEGGDHQARHVEEFVPSEIMERHLRQRPRAEAVPPAGRPPGRRRRRRPAPPGSSG